MVEKTQSKQNISKSKKVLYIILSVVVGLLILGGAITAFVLNYNQFSPAKVTVIEDGRAVYLQAEMNDNYLSYNFKFSAEGEDIIIESENNILTIADLLENGIQIGQEYDISVCYVSQNAGNNSQYSEPLTWTVSTFLDSPTITYSQEEDLISWQSVDNADYYLVFYSGMSEPAEVTEPSINLQTIAGGEREFYVQARAYEEYYIPSPLSNALELSVVHNFLPFSEVSFDSESKTITIIGSEDLPKFYIYLNGQPIECITFDKSFDGENFVYLVDITLYYQDGMTIGASPMTIDSYNIYQGQITMA